MQIKLNALSWLGIVLSVIWFNFFMGYFLYYRAQDPNRYFIDASNVCDNALQASNDSAILIDGKDERIAQQATNRAVWKKCRDDVQLPYRRKLDRIYKRIPFVAAAALGTITFGWVLAWSGILLARRIKRRSGKGNSPHALP
jgi:hypothetical protein